MKIYITGVAGTGKSSIIRALQARGINAIDMDNGLCHWEHKESGDMAGWEPGRDKEWYESHGWMCNVEELKRLLSQNETVVAAGLSSNQEQYLPLFDKILILHSSPETFIARIEARTDNDYGKHPAEQERLLTWHDVYEKEMKEKGAIVINAERPLDEVVEDVCSYL